ncbi:hypothetical protein MSAN_02136200 [Mycena sanguinolenta]|uniref:Uncharacterized protein n=1 Tax=Mycena sanguinolenta TaxID=230812 RepID=A0A8H6XGC5_9AGAR|nr:hypothetical protein MSAN_02136200 [Mycena sanguinolenta]
MISYRFRKFWIVIKVPILRQCIFMRTAYVTFPPPVLGLTYRKNQDFTEAFNYLYSAFQRAFSGEVLNNTLSISLYSLWDADDHTWLSQANHIFCRLNIVSNFEDYVDSDGEDFDADIKSNCNSTWTEDYESESPPTSACDDHRDLDVDAEAMHPEKDAHDAAGENHESDHTEILNCANHNTSRSTLEEDMVAEEIFVPSPTFRIVFYIQLLLISFLALSGVHHHVW